VTARTFLAWQQPSVGLGEPGVLIMRETTKRRVVGKGIVALVAALASIVATSSTADAKPRERIRVTELATFVSGPCTDDICSTGSTIGPDGALYVTDATNGRIRRIDRRTGAVTTFADGLPKSIPGVVGGGVVDVAFRGRTAYALVTGVSTFWTDLLSSPVPPASEGVYRLDGAGAGAHPTLIADLATWSAQHLPTNAEDFVFSPAGFTYAIETYRDGFLVTDAHHNRVLRVRLDGRTSNYADFGRDIVPTGLELDGRPDLVALAGPVPHVAGTGKVLALRRAGVTDLRTVAAGAPLLVDVERGRHQAVYGLSQGFWPYAGQEGKEGYPAAPDTGKLMRAGHDGQFRAVATRLDRPTTFELVGRTAYVVTITGKVLKVSGLKG
jgi:hypothetical protein